MRLRAAFAAGLAAIAVSGAAAAAEPSEPYVVKAGDTLYDLGRNYLVNPGDYRLVQRLNGIADPRRIMPGRTLRIPVRLLRTRPVEVRVGAYRGPVQATLAGRPLALSVGTVLPEGTVIATGPNAFLRLDLPDGARVSAPSQSRLRLGAMRVVEMTGVVRREIVVESGRLESEVTPLRDRRDSYTVRTPLSVSAVRGTVFRVAYDPAGAVAQTEVVEGTVAVGDKARETNIPASYGALVTAEGVSEPLALAPPPKLVDPGKVQDAPQVAFTVAQDKPMRGYSARLAADAGFLDVVDQATSDSPALTFQNLPDGMYFVRLAAFDEHGLLGSPATYAFERRLNTLTAGPPTSAIDGGVRRYRFQWTTEGQGKRAYRFQIFADGAAVPMIDQPGLEAQTFTVTQLPPGVYVWRVMSRTFANGAHTDKWSAPERFEVAR